MAAPYRSSSSHHLLLHLILLFLVLSPVQAGDQQTESKDKKLTPAERSIGITGFNSRWETLRSWIKLAWMDLRPPDSGYGQPKSGAGEKMKAASKRSFEASKEAVEQTAAAAAKATGEAVGMAKEKLKRAVSKSDGDEDAEL